MPERIPPNSVSAENATLSAAMLDVDALMDITEIVRPEDFYTPANREIYTAIWELHKRNEAVDLVTVCEELSRRNALELAGGRVYVSSLTEESPSTVNAAGYAKIVAKKATLRRLIAASDYIRDKSFEEELDTDVVLDMAEQKIFDIAQGRQTGKPTHIKEILLENTNMIDRARKAGGILGLTTGFSELDAATSGLKKSNLIVVAARPSMGKTAFALNMALNAAKKQDAKVLIFSLEMAKEELGQRMLSMESNIELGRIIEGKIDNGDWTDINLAIDRMAATTIQIDDGGGGSIMEIRNKCRRMKASVGLDLVVIDFLQLMSVEGRAENRQQEISKLSRGLKLMARDLEVPVVVLSQLSRAPEARTDHEPVLSDLRESGAIEQDADMVILLYREDYYNKESEHPNVCKVKLAKNRNGQTKDIYLTWVARYTKFSDGAIIAE